MKITNDGDIHLDSASLGDIFAASLYGEEVRRISATQQMPVGTANGGGGKRLMIASISTFGPIAGLIAMDRRLEAIEVTKKYTSVRVQE